MKNDIDLARETAEWLNEGSRPLPAGVLEGAMSEVSRTRQLSPAHPRWTVRLARAVALGAAAAAVVMAVAYGPLVADGIRGLLLPPASTPIGASPSPGPAGRIAFTSDRDGNREIYVMNADGSGQTNVTNSPAADYFDSWSPDGSRIVFSSDRDGNRELYVMNADGSGVTRLTNNPCGIDSLDAWSPDGSRIAFTSGLNGNFGGGPPAVQVCVATIYVGNADGSGLTNLTNLTSPGADEFGAWSPDGSRIAFTRGANGNRDVYVVNADGSGLTNLGSPGPIFNGGTPAGPCFDVGLSPVSGGISPDGARVAFFSNRDGNEELYVMKADGSGVTRLTNNPASDSNLVWSPDSSRIAFHSNRDGNREIYVINADGSGLTNLSNGPGDPFLAAGGWSPDGSRIAFVSNRDGNGEIYVVNADGSGLTNLSNSPGEDYDPVWSPAR